jgi:hypothetical protein
MNDAAAGGRLRLRRTIVRSDARRSMEPLKEAEGGMRARKFYVEILLVSLAAINRS